MFKDRIIKELGLITLVKFALIAAVYYACFAAYDGRPIDTAAHILGPLPAQHQTNFTNQGS